MLMKNELMNRTWSLCVGM